MAKSAEGNTVSTIRIDAKENVWVNGKRVNAKRSDGALVFRNGAITYTIQGDRRLKGEDIWSDSKVGAWGASSSSKPHITRNSIGPDKATTIRELTQHNGRYG